MSEAAAFRILDAASAMGVRAFDTAEAYGSSSARLRAWIDARNNADSVEIITKCSIDSSGQPLNALEEKADKALARFDGIEHVIVLTHGAVGADLWSAVVAASSRHHASAGQSVYSPEEVTAACALSGIEMMQVPGNILDQRAIQARGDSGVPLDVRSIYLQGVLLDDPNDADRRAPGSGRISAGVQSAAASLGIPAAQLLVASMLRVIGPRDRLVIGVDDVSELEVLPAAFEVGDDVVRQFQSMMTRLADDPALDRLLDRLLDPRTWPAKLAV